MAKKQKTDGGWGSWALIVFLFAVNLWPVALVMLLVKLFGRDEKQIPPPSLQTGEPGVAQRPARQTRAGTAAKKAMRTPADKRSTAKKLKIIGIVLAAAGVLAASEALGMLPYSSDWLGLWLEDFLGGAAVAAGGLAMCWKGVSMDRSLGRYARYLSVMGDREAMPVEELARTLGYPERRVERDLQKMIEKGYFGGKAYLNVELGYLFRSSQADADWKRRQQEAQAAPTPKEAEEGYSGILRNIRRANDAIADPVLSAKIDRLESITARIFQAVEADPRKRDRIGTFLDYYLPTTQKLLDSYAQFEAAGVEGENLRQAKSRIESTMDSIIRGFEHQLDALYQADAMDVDSDIRVMETMLRRDTATTQEDFGLGGAQDREDRE